MIGARIFTVPVHGPGKPSKPVEVSVFEVDEDEAKPAFLVTGPDGMRTLKLFEGRFYARFAGAPWIGRGIPDDTFPALSGDAIDDYLSHRLIGGEPAPPATEWACDPLSFAAPRPATEPERALLSDTIGRMRFARAAAAADYAIIGGDLHRQTQEPCWLVAERGQGVGPVASIPTYGHHLGAWRFRGDRLSDAMAFSREHVERRQLAGEAGLRVSPPVGSIECLLAGADFGRNDAVMTAIDRGEDILVTGRSLPADQSPAVVAPEEWAALEASVRRLPDPGAATAFFTAAQALEGALSERGIAEEWVSGVLGPANHRARFEAGTSAAPGPGVPLPG